MARRKLSRSGRTAAACALVAAIGWCTTGPVFADEELPPAPAVDHGADETDETDATVDTDETDETGTTDTTVDTEDTFDDGSATGEVDGATVAVGAPPVPPVVQETVVVAVGQPPVPPAVVAVGKPPVPASSSVEVAVGKPPVPHRTARAASPESAPATAPPALSDAIDGAFDVIDRCFWSR